MLSKLDRNLSEALDDMRKVYEKSGQTGFHVIGTHAFETSGQQTGMKGTVESTRSDGKVLRQLLYYFERKDRVKVVVCCSATDVGDLYDEAFDKIVRTFRVTR